MTAVVEAPRPHGRGRGNTGKICMPFLEWHSYASGKTEPGNVVLRARISGSFSYFQQPAFFVTIEKVKIMVSLCINYRCGTSRTTAMANVQNHSDFRCALLKTYPFFPFLISYLKTWKWRTVSS